MVIYLSGPMTGQPKHGFPAFDESRERLRSLGHIVMCPAEMTREYFEYRYGRAFDPDSDEDVSLLTYEDLMFTDLQVLLGCEAIAMLPGWHKSVGALVELIVASVTGKKIFDAVSMQEMPSTVTSVAIALNAAASKAGR